MSDFSNIGTNTLSIVMSSTKNIGIFDRNIRLSCSENNKLDEAKYRRVLYQTVHDIMSGKSLKDALAEIKNKKIDTNHKHFENIRIKQDQRDKFLVEPFKVAEGAVQCRKCKSNRVLSYSVQCRGADEPMTSFCTCSNCGVEWTYSG